MNKNACTSAGKDICRAIGTHLSSMARNSAGRNHRAERRAAPITASATAETPIRHASSWAMVRCMRDALPYRWSGAEQPHSVSGAAGGAMYYAYLVIVLAGLVSARVALLQYPGRDLFRRNRLHVAIGLLSTMILISLFVWG